MSDFTDIQRDLEVKARRLIRRVRTPEGMEHFGQPIGSIITRDVVRSGAFSVGGRRQSIRGSMVPNQPRSIADAAVVDEAVADAAVVDEARKPAPVATEVPTDYEGTRKWKVPGRRGRVYTWQDEEDKTWILADHKDEILAEGDTEQSVIDAIKKLIKATPAKRTRAPRKGLRQFRSATDEDLKKLEEVHKIKIGPNHIYRSTMEVGEEDNWWELEPVVRWTDKRGKIQSTYSQAHTDRQARAKFEIIKKLSKEIDKLDDYLNANWRSDDTAAALFLMRKTAIRPSSMNNETGDQATYGITNMQARHVTVNQNSVRLQFTAKKGVEQDFTYRDPELVELFTIYKGDKQRREEIFPGASDHTMRQMMKEVLGDEYFPYNLRTLLATQYALQLVEARKRPSKPKNKTEFNKWRREVATSVSQVLGNKPAEALKSYIDPDVFSEWQDAIDDA